MALVIRGNNVHHHVLAFAVLLALVFAVMVLTSRGM
jgi:hypothetical protein